MGFLDSLKGLLSDFRSETYPNFRNKLATTALDLGGKSTGMEGKQLLHEGGNYAATKKLGESGYIPPEIAANLVDAGYLGNEAFTGALAKITGRPFFSDYGFRWGDVAMNRRGQDRAISELRAKQALEGAKRAEVERGRQPIPFGGKE